MVDSDGTISAAGIVLGLILGKIGESAFAKTMQLFDYNPIGFFDRPIALFLLAIAILTIINGIIKEIRAKRGTRMLLD